MPDELNETTPNKPDSKRKCGGQPGNQNARKHGYYTLSLSPAERVEFLNLTEKEGLEQDLAFLRTRIKTILEKDPVDRRALSHTLKLLSNWGASQYHLEASESRYLRKYIRTLFIEDILHSKCQVLNNAGLNKTTESGSVKEI